MLGRRPASQRKASRLSESVLHGIRAVETAVHVDDTIGDALASLRERKIDHPVVYVYAVDDDDRLLGQVPTRALLFAPPTARVREVMRTGLTTIPADTPLSEALGIFASRRLLALPVVDSEGRLLGALDVELYARESLELAERERVRQVFETLGLSIGAAQSLSPWEGFRMRMPWLLCNVAGGLLCAVIAWLFGGLLERVVWLAFFLPLVLTLAESVAMQSLSITVGIAPEKRTLGTALRALRAEASTAMLLALACGGVVALASSLGSAGGAGALTMFAAVTGSMVFAAVAGGAVPLVLHGCRLDPKVAAGPVALVIADTAATALYFALGLAILMPAPAP